MIRYFGCENAASATAKIEVPDIYSGKLLCKLFFGREEDCLDWLERYTKLCKKQSDKCLCYIREVLNWETGRLGGWQIQKSNWG